MATSSMSSSKTAQRSSLGKNLKNLMAWHTMGKDLSCAQVPVMDILAEFRALAGIRGRNAHRGTNPPQYDHRVKVELELGVSSLRTRVLFSLRLWILVSHITIILIIEDGGS